MPNTPTGFEPDTPLGHALTDTYAVLAAVLNRAPSADLLGQLRHAKWHPELPQRLVSAYIDLRQAARTHPAHAIEREFHALFIGLGQGEVVPYASAYLEGALMALPLARLRADLNKRGLARRKEVPEAEDHAGLLCEAVALLRYQRKIAPDDYARFLHEHVISWMLDFFSDLEKAPSAGFYRSVASLGKCLLQLEQIDLTTHHATGVS